MRLRVPLRGRLINIPFNINVSRRTWAIENSGIKKTFSTITDFVDNIGVTFGVVR
jgi:hypothetical protein